MVAKRIVYLSMAFVVVTFLILWSIGLIGLWSGGLAHIASNTKEFHDKNSHLLEGEYSVSIDLSDLESNVGKELYNDGTHRIYVSWVDNTGNVNTGGYRIGFRSGGHYSLNEASLISGGYHTSLDDNSFTYSMTASMITEYNNKFYTSSVYGLSGLNYKDGDDFSFYIFPSTAYNSEEISLDETGVVHLTLTDLYKNIWTKKGELIQSSGISEIDVAQWIRTQGDERKEPNSYYFEGLTFEQANVDGDPELEVLARIDAGVHLGHFFIFDKQPNNDYMLIYEQPWHVDSWNLDPLYSEGSSLLFQINTRTGGSGTDVIEAHLMHWSESGEWIEAWSGHLKDRSTFQEHIYLTIGSFQINDETGQLFYWQTEMDTELENNKEIRNPQTTMKVFEWVDGIFLETPNENSDEHLKLLNIELPEDWILDQHEANIYHIVDETGESRGSISVMKYSEDFDLITQMPNHSTVMKDEYLDIPLGQSRFITLDTDNGSAASGVTGTHDTYYVSIPIHDEIIYIINFSNRDKSTETRNQFIELLELLSLNNEGSNK